MAAVVFGTSSVQAVFFARRGWRGDRQNCRTAVWRAVKTFNRAAAAFTGVCLAVTPVT
jgi:hypothetical protein